MHALFNKEAITLPKHNYRTPFDRDSLQYNVAVYEREFYKGKKESSVSLYFWTKRQRISFQAVEYEHDIIIIGQ